MFQHLAGMLLKYGDPTELAPYKAFLEAVRDGNWATAITLLRSTKTFTTWAGSLTTAQKNAYRDTGAGFFQMLNQLMPVETLKKILRKG